MSLVSVSDITEKAGLASELAQVKDAANVEVESLLSILDCDPEVVVNFLETADNRHFVDKTAKILVCRNDGHIGQAASCAGQRCRQIFRCFEAACHPRLGAIFRKASG